MSFNMTESDWSTDRKILTATVEKEWCEVWRKGRGKVEDWSWCVSYYDASMFEVDGTADSTVDRKWMKCEADAKLNAALFEMGCFVYGTLSEVVIDNVFEDIAEVDIDA